MTKASLTSLQATGLVKKFDTVTAVNNVSFSATKGDVVGFLGPNGAGKSTTMRMLTGFLTPTSGTAYINGYSIIEEPLLAKSCLGYLPEGSPLYLDMTVKSLITFVAKIHGLVGQRLTDRLAYLVELLGLSAVWQQNIEKLSKGFKRRVGLALALVHDPKILILDEPTDGLDPNQKYDVRNLIKHLAKEKVIIISTHILEEVEMVCNRVILINSGKIIVDSTPLDLIEQSSTHNTVIITVRNISPNIVLTTLKNLPFIETAEFFQEVDINVSFSIKTKPSNLNNLNALINQMGWDLTDFYLRRGQLDEVFRTMTNHKHIVQEQHEALV